MKKEIFAKIIGVSLYSLVFLLPLFWLPFSFEVYEFNKLYLLLFLVLIAFSSFLLWAIVWRKEFRFLHTSLDIPILLFLGASIFSAVFSIEKLSSLFGFYLRFSNGLIALFLLMVFGFLIANGISANEGQRIKEKNEKKNIFSFSLSVDGLLKVFLVSVFLVILTSYLSIFGVWQKISKFFPLALQRVVTERSFNPTTGSLEGLAIFMAVITVLASGLIICGKRKFNKMFLGIVLAGCFGLLAIIDFNPAWIVLISGLAFLLFLSLVNRIFKENVNQLLLPIILIMGATIFLLFVDIEKGSQSMFPIPQEAVLNSQISWQVAFSTVKENLKSLVLGSGLGTWYHDFARYKAVDFNLSRFWNIRFDRSGSYISELLATGGILSIVCYFLIVATFFLGFWSTKEKRRSLPLAATFFALISAYFFYYQNMVLAFTFWFVLGLAQASFELPQKFKRIVKIPLSFKKFPELGLVVSISLVLFCFFVVGILYFGVRFYWADINYTKAQPLLTQYQNSGQKTLLEESLKSLLKSIYFNPRVSVYRMLLARTYLFLAIEEVNKPAEEQDVAETQERVALAVDQAVEQAQITTVLSPNNVAAWETLGVVYREIQPLLPEAIDWAIDSFEKAVVLEDTNPALYTEIGKLYLKQNDLEKARENFEKAKQVKPNYSEARLQLGLIHFNEGQMDDAALEFETVIGINPNDSNALYSLGLIYSNRGEKEKAISLFERVLELNPGNENVINKLEELGGE